MIGKLLPFRRARLVGTTLSDEALLAACATGDAAAKAELVARHAEALHRFLGRLRGADARDAVFDLADLTAADCTEALLQGAHVRQARLHYACLRHAFLLSAHLEHASLQETDFTGANCEWAWVDGLDFQEAIVSCTLFLNARGLSALAQRTIEARGGFTGRRPMILGRELYEGPLSGPTTSSV